MALIVLVGTIMSALDTGAPIMEILSWVFCIDLSKAFDTVNHNIHVVLNKLYKYGFRGICHDWLKNFLFNRKHGRCCI